MQKKNRLLHIILLIIMLFSMGINQTAVTAQEEIPPLQSGDFTFQELGWEDALLEGPLSEQAYTFNLPGHLSFTGSMLIKLHTELVLELDASTTGYLSIYVNDQLVDVLPVTKGVAEDMQIEVPLSTLRLGEEEDQQTISFLYENDDCDRDSAAMFHIMDESIINMTFAEQPITTRITRFPSPFYRENSLPTPVKTYLILPPAPNQETLLAAINVGAGLGNLFEGTDNFEVRSWTDVTEAEKQENHLVFIGLPQDLPAQVRNLSQLNQTYPQESGILEVFQSPWNSARAIFIVTANGLPGLTLASEAITYDELRIPYLNQNIALIKDLNVDNALIYNPNFSEITIDSFGYDNRTVANIGLNYSTYSFQIPIGYQSTENSEFMLHYDFSDMINKDASGVSVRVNGNLIDGLLLSNKETTETLTKEIPIPATYLYEGENIIQFVANLVPINVCMNENNLNPVWFTIFNDSVAKFDLEPIQTTVAQQKWEDLTRYPNVLSKNNRLNSTTFILPDENQTAKESAVIIAYQLGSEYTNVSSNLNLSYDLSQEVSQSQEIFIGLPNQLTILDEYTQKLPLEFDQDNKISQSYATVAYESPIGANIGYVLIPMRNAQTDQTPIFILGETNQGIKNTSIALAQNPNDFFGNLAVVLEDDIYSYRVSVEQDNITQFTEESNNNNQNGIDDADSTMLDPSEFVDLNTSSSQIQVNPQKTNFKLDLTSPILQIAIISLLISVGIILIPLFLAKKEKPQGGKKKNDDL